MVDPKVAQALAVPVRVRLVEILASAGEPQSVPDLARTVGLHVNTVRSHMELLVEAGLAARAAGGRVSGPGRPLVYYQAAALTVVPAARRGTTGCGGMSACDGYRVLASALANEIAAGDDAARVADDAGRRWVATIEELGWQSRPHQAAEGRALLVSLMDRLGFAPRTEPLSDRIHLHACPFADLARANPTVVCGVHLGLLRGAIDRLRTPLTVAALEPLFHHDRCLVRLSTTAE